MEKNEMLEKLKKVRNIRNGLGELDLDNYEKEVLRKCLNYYEDNLILDLTRSNNIANILDSNNMKHDIELVEIPKDNESSRYKEYANVSDLQVNEYLNRLSDNVFNIDISIDLKVILLNAIKDYCIYKEQVASSVKTNQEIYNDIFNKGK